MSRSRRKNISATTWSGTWDVFQFISAWLRDDVSLKRKKQYSQYYIKRFENTDFLMFLPSDGSGTDLVGARIRGTINGKAHNIILWDKEVVDPDNFVFPNGTIYPINHELWEEHGLDITEAKLIDAKDCDTFSSYLLSVDGKRVLLDHVWWMKFSKGYPTEVSVSAQEILAFKDVALVERKVAPYYATRVLATWLIQGEHPNNIRLARMAMIPEECRYNLSATCLSGCWFLPTQEIPIVITPEIIETAKWEPNAKIFGVSDFSSSHLNKTIGWLVHEGYTPEQAQSIWDYTKALEKWTEAYKAITGSRGSHVFSHDSLHLVTDGKSKPDAFISASGKVCVKGAVSETYHSRMTLEIFHNWMEVITVPHVRIGPRK